MTTETGTVENVTGTHTTIGADGKMLITYERETGDNGGDVRPIFSKNDGVKTRNTRPEALHESGGFIHHENVTSQNLMGTGYTFDADQFRDGWVVPHAVEPYAGQILCMDQENDALTTLRAGPQSGSDTAWTNLAMQFNLMHSGPGGGQSFGFRSLSYNYINPSQDANPTLNNIIAGACLPAVNGMYQGVYPIWYDDPVKMQRELDQKTGSIAESLRVIHAYNPGIPLYAAVRMEWDERSDGTRAGEPLTVEELVMILQPVLTLVGPDGQQAMPASWTGTYDYYPRALEPINEADEIRRPIYSRLSNEYNLAFHMSNRVNYCHRYNLHAYQRLRDAYDQILAGA